MAKIVRVMPSARLEEIGCDVICDYVASGESLNSWCLANSFTYNTVLNWINADARRTANYAHAREMRADLVFESLDDVSNAAVMAETAIEVAGLRLKSDNIKWKLARMASKYGDKQTIDLNAKIELSESAIDEKLARILNTSNTN